MFNIGDHLANKRNKNGTIYIVTDVDVKSNSYHLRHKSEKTKNKITTVIDRTYAHKNFKYA